jgi:hypothetical protein
MEPWFFGCISAQQAAIILATQPPTTYMLRLSEKFPDKPWTLSVVTDTLDV